MRRIDAGALQLPAPTDWQRFERLCRDLWAITWVNPQLERNGRSGQAQHGIDIFGNIGGEAGKLGGIQCKRVDSRADESLTVDELITAVDAAKTFTPALREFVLAYTGRNDAQLQAEARRLTDLHKSSGLFEVRVASWGHMTEMLGKHPELIEQYGLMLPASVLRVQPNARQLELCRRLDELHALYGGRVRPSEMFKGALAALGASNGSNPDWLAQAAHSLREILYPFDTKRKRRRAFETFGSVGMSNAGLSRLERVYGALTEVAHHCSGPRCKQAYDPSTTEAFELLLVEFERILTEVLARQLDVHKRIDELLSIDPTTITDTSDSSE